MVLHSRSSVTASATQVEVDFVVVLILVGLVLDLLGLGRSSGFTLNDGCLLRFGIDIVGGLPTCGLWECLGSLIVIVAVQRRLGQDMRFVRAAEKRTGP